MPPAADVGDDEPPAVRGRDDRLRAGAGQAGVDLLGRLEGPVDQPRDEDVVDPATRLT